MEKLTFEYVNSKKEVCQYRFTDGICDGFFVNDQETTYDYKGKMITEDWIINLKEAGFIKVIKTNTHHGTKDK